MKAGKAIRLVRGARGLTQKELANKCGLDPSFISLVERDLREPSMSVMTVLAEKLRTPLYLLVLLGSEPAELKGVTEPQAQSLGRELLRVLLESEDAS